MRMKKLILIAVLAVFSFACQQDASSSWNDLDLMENGFPIVVQAPDSAKVSVMDNMGFIQDITIDSPDDNYHIQIYASDAQTDDIALIKADLINDVRNNPFFSRIVKEDERGFLYEITIDSINYYSFRHVHVQGSTEFVFQSGIAQTFDEAQARRLMNAVQQKVD